MKTSGFVKIVYKTTIMLAKMKNLLPTAFCKIKVNNI